MECLDDNVVADVFDGGLPPEAVEQIDRHAADCVACRSLLAAFARAFAPTGEEAPADAAGLALPLLHFAHVRAHKRLGTTVGGKWTLDRVLGVGGTAEVYAATHRNGGKVAIKLLRPELAEAGPMFRRFLREGYVANRVGHPGTVRVLDDDVTEEGTPFLVMDLLDGLTLRQKVDRDGALSVEEAVRLGDAMLDVLGAAHDKGIVHRDIKPENVFLTSQGELKVLDFGIARLHEMSQERGTTEPGIKMGTPAYMAPEQARGESSEIGPRSDLWAVGATMALLLTGAPIRGPVENGEQELYLAMTQPPRSILELRPSLPAALARVVDRALAFRSEDRWPDARAMQEALRAAASQASADVPRLSLHRMRGLVLAAIALTTAIALFLTRARPERATSGPAAAPPSTTVIASESPPARSSAAAPESLPDPPEPASSLASVVATAAAAASLVPVAPPPPRASPAARPVAAAQASASASAAPSAALSSAAPSSSSALPPIPTVVRNPLERRH